MTKTVTKTIDIVAGPEAVWDFVSDLSRWNTWAIHNVFDVRRGDDGWYLMDGLRGTSRVKMHGHKTLGILDHEFIDPGEGRWAVPCRVVAGSEGAHLMMTFTKPEQLPDETFERGMNLLSEELQKLKECVERR